ncbi:MAG: phosphoribosyltransferase, partial [Bacteroidota bacterium]
MYTDRRDAGRRLATATEHLKGQSPVVVTIPRGGVPVAVEVALALKAPIEIVAVTKMVSSHAPDVEVGAVGSDGIEIIEPFMVHLSGLSSSDLDFALRVAHRRVGEISA